MKHWLGPSLALLGSAIAAHFTVLHFAPGLIMDRAMSELAKRGVGEHAFTQPLRITPETQTVVRSSPDLFYALCRYDLGDEDKPLRIVMGEWPDYQSLSFFDARTNNYATYRGTGQRIEVQLVGPEGNPAEDTIASPTMRGVILIRRLAPTQELFDKATQAARSDECAFLS